MRISMFAVSTAVAALHAPVMAETPLAAAGTAASAETAPDEDPIIVEGERSSYGAGTIGSATKTATPVKDVPQALTVITKAQIDDQQLRSIGELLTFVPGASAATGEANRDQMTLRGNNTTADFFVDGLRDDVQYFRDFYNLERVEVLKGPNAMIFGRGGGGGIVNRVTKQTRFDTRRGASIGSTSFGGLRATADLDQPLADGISARLNGLYEKGESFRRHVELERYGINPTVGFAVGPDSRIDLAYEYFHDRRTTDRGLPSVTDPAGIDKPLTGFDKVFFGDPDDSFAKANINVVSFAIEHRLGDGLTLKNRTKYGDYDKFYQNIYPNSAVLPADLLNPQPGVRLAAYKQRNDRNNLISQTDLVWENRLVGIDQTMLVGFEAGHQKSRNMRVSGTFVGSNRVPLNDPTVDANVIFTPVGSDANNRTKASIAAFYVQDQIRPTDWLEIVAGLRFDRFKLAVDDFRGAGAEFNRVDNLWSPRFGLVLKPIEQLSLYASYSRSYLPQSGDQFSGLDVTSQALKPERFDNYEIGAKWEPVDGLLATAAIYHLDRSNTRATDPANPARTVLTGAQRSRGFELGLERSITHRWQISAGYAWQKAEITETTTAAPEGREVPLVPRHSASLWTKYEVTPKLGLGLGVIARSKSFASISNQVKLPGYARVDAAAFYEVMRGVQAQLNVENLFDTDYFWAAHNDNNIAPGAPRSAKVTFKFGI